MAQSNYWYEAMMDIIEMGRRERLKELERVAKIVAQVRFPKYTFEVKVVGDGYTVHVEYDEPDVFTGAVETQHGREWYFPAGQTSGQIVQTCFKAILTSLEHRAREHFLFNGKPVLQPHLDIDKIWEMLPEREVSIEPELFEESR